ncbi:helix-turn-helix domain-containing protein [Archangium primigenium]|uniref:helix-turn-helix domain-containing protein n=1 Tax=[Archangium] primigenium TaxID=2792470 RepID=UPI001959CD42|nr:helix-turn-helix domain-containing protein [Archangium primigenium]MBM7115709.1 transposase [Archangium primigenium]
MSTGKVTPTELRQAIVRAHEQQHLGYEQTARLLGVSEATVSRVLRLYRETGDVTPRPRGGGRFSPLRGEVADTLERLVLRDPGATVTELKEQLAALTGVVTSRSALQRALHRLGFSYKKSPLSPPSGTLLPTSGAATFLLLF